MLLHEVRGAATAASSDSFRTAYPATAAVAATGIALAPSSLYGTQQLPGSFLADVWSHPPPHTLDFPACLPVLPVLP